MNFIDVLKKRRAVREYTHAANSAKGDRGLN